MKIKSFAAALAAAALSAACLVGTAFAAGGPSVSVSTAEAAPGAGATVSVSLSGNEGFGSFGMVLDYDKDKLELTGISKGALCSDGLFSASAATGIVGFVGNSEVKGDGVLFTATFKVLEGASAGDVPVEVGVVVDEMTAYSGDSIDTGSVAVSKGAVTAKHQHSWAGEWTSDEAGHWHACSCGAKSDEAAHDFSGELVVDVAADYGIAGSGHYECLVCGKVSSDVVIPALHYCEFSDEWSCDEKTHWHACAYEGCLERDSEAAHSFGDWVEAEGDLLPAGTASAKVRICSVCGCAEYKDVVSVVSEGSDEDSEEASGSSASSGKGLSQTGDALPAAACAFAALAFVSGGAALALRRKNAA